MNDQEYLASLGLLNLAEYKKPPNYGETLPCGISFMDRNLKWSAGDGEICVIVGGFGSGKSLLAGQLAAYWAKLNAGKSSIGAVMYSFEDHPAQQQKRIVDRLGAKNVAVYDVAKAVEPVTFKKVLSTFEEINETYGTQMFVIDPWTSLMDNRDRRTPEHEHIRACLNELAIFTHKTRSKVLVVCHVTKGQYSKDGSPVPFGIDAAMGSAHFGGLAFRGIAVNRASLFHGSKSHTILNFDKVKVEQIYGIGREVVACTVDRESEELLQDVSATHEAAKIYRKPPGGLCEGITREEHNDAPKGKGVTYSFGGDQ